ncbi:MAG: hypothetical protein ABJA78_01655 [Ferruginibacter sp.]
MNKTIARGILIPLFIILLMIFNFMRIEGSDCVRTIHIVSLLAMGAAIGMLLMNIATLIRNRKK